VHELDRNKKSNQNDCKGPCARHGLVEYSRQHERRSIGEMGHMDLGIVKVYFDGGKNATAYVPEPTPIHAACLTTSRGLVTCSGS